MSDPSSAVPSTAVLAGLREELRARFADSPLPQGRVDLSGRVLEVNAAFAALLGRSPEELVGADGLAMFGPHEQAGLLDGLARLARGEVPVVQQEHLLQTARGERSVVITAVTVLEPDGGTVLATTLEDVTELRAAQRSTGDAAARFDALVSSLPIIVFTFDEQGVCTSSRGAALRHLGLVDDELVGRSLLDLYGDDPEVVAALAGALVGRTTQVLREAGGRWWDGRYSGLPGPDGGIAGGIGVAVDVTERVLAEQAALSRAALTASLLEHASDVALVCDERGHVSWVSPAVHEQLGWTVEEMTGRRATDFNPPEDRAAVADAWQRVAGQPGATTRAELRVLAADGSVRWSEQHYTNLLHDPAVAGVVVNVRDVTERRRAEDELRRLAVRDALTGLVNRTLLLDRTEQAMAAGSRRGTLTGLVVLDVVGMAGHNESLGQAGGDALLVALARRLEAVVRPGDSLARTGGDELAVLLEDLASAEELRALVTALLEAVDEPVRVGVSEVPVRLRAGSALCPAVDAGSLLAAAERAVPRTPAAGPALVAPRDHDDRAAEELACAVAGGQLRLHFQPLLRLADGAVAGAEALVRWEHPERGLLLPVDFVPLAEATGVVVELGAWVLREAVRAQAEWAAAGHRVPVAVNLSPVQLVDRGLPRLVAEVLSSAGADGLVLEVTESAVMDDPGAAEVLDALRRLGVALALDDFGTGYSSLTYLKRFPVDTIKVDRSFVAGLGQDSDDEAIVASVASLGRAVGKTVVAEGVETPAQRDALRALGVDQAQGYLFCRPVPSDELLVWLDEQRPEPARTTESATAAPPVVLTGSAEERILALQAEGASLHTIAAGLNAEGRRTSGGVRWTPTTVARVVAELLRQA